MGRRHALAPLEHPSLPGVRLPCAQLQRPTAILHRGSRQFRAPQRAGRIQGHAAAGLSQLRGRHVPVGAGGARPAPRAGRCRGLHLRHHPVPRALFRRRRSTVPGVGPVSLGALRLPPPREGAEPRHVCPGEPLAGRRGAEPQHWGHALRTRPGRLPRLPAADIPTVGLARRSGCPRSPHLGDLLAARAGRDALHPRPRPDPGPLGRARPLHPAGRSLRGLTAARCTGRQPRAAVQLRAAASAARRARAGLGLPPPPGAQPPRTSGDGRRPRSGGRVHDAARVVPRLGGALAAALRRIPLAPFRGRAVGREPAGRRVAGVAAPVAEVASRGRSRPRPRDPDQHVRLPVPTVVPPAGGDARSISRIRDLFPGHWHDRRQRIPAAVGDADSVPAGRHTGPGTAGADRAAPRRNGRGGVGEGRFARPDGGGG